MVGLDESIRADRHLTYRPFDHIGERFGQHGGVNQAQVRDQAIFLTKIIGGPGHFGVQCGTGVIIIPEHSYVHVKLLVEGLSMEIFNTKGTKKHDEPQRNIFI
jgi:hypothetical protein